MRDILVVLAAFARSKAVSSLTHDGGSMRKVSTGGFGAVCNLTTSTYLMWFCDMIDNH